MLGIDKATASGHRTLTGLTLRPSTTWTANYVHPMRDCDNTSLSVCAEMRIADLSYLDQLSIFEILETDLASNVEPLARRQIRQRRNRPRILITALLSHVDLFTLQNG